MNAVLFWTGALGAILWTWAVYRLAYRRGLEAGHTEADEQRAGVTRPHPSWFFQCPTCGPRVAVDEDRCCVTCGADTAVVGPYPPPAPKHTLEGWPS